MNRGRKAQVTIFIILALIIIIGVLVYFVIKGNFNSNPSEDSKYNSVPDYVKFCLKDSLTAAIYFNAMQGGYFVSPNNSIEYNYLLIPIYWKNNQSSMISQDELKNQLELAIKTLTENCVGNFDEFTKKGYNITSNEIQNVTVNIKDNSISAKINFPIFSKLGETTNEYSNFEESSNFKLLEKYNIIKQAINLQGLTPNDIPITQYSEIAYDNNIQFEILQLDNSTFLYSFAFPEKELNINYTYAFIGQYQK